MVAIEVLGTKEVKEFLKKVAKELGHISKESITKAAFHLQNEVKESITGHRAEPTSVDTGQFLNSVDVQVTSLGAIVFSDVEHSKFLEYGTSKINARSHFRNSAARNTLKIREIVADDVNKAIS